MDAYALEMGRNSASPTKLSRCGCSAMVDALIAVWLRILLYWLKTAGVGVSTSYIVSSSRLAALRIYLR